MKENLSVLKALFRDYYTRASLDLPSDFYVREFAIQPIGVDTYVRHLSFSSVSELKQYLIANVPLHLYYSSAKYREPGNTTMSEKGWMGSDLVFDIDADHLPKCADRIELWYCKSCGFTATYTDVKTCPHCGSKLSRFDHVGPSCIDIAKYEVLKLIDVLEHDLGYTNMKLAFSGHRGFHIVVELLNDESLMDTDARREIIDYLKLSQINIENLKIRVLRHGKSRILTLPPRITDGGVRRRIAKYLASKISQLQIREFILGRSWYIDVSTILKYANEINRLIDEAVSEAAIHVDEKVTIDTSRLVRVPMSINGKSGWLVVPINDLDISSFSLDPTILSPFNNIMFSIVILVRLPEIVVIDRKFKFNQGDRVVLEGAYALYFVLKGVAKIVGIKR